jgi:hypothetical protein
MKETRKGARGGGNRSFVFDSAKLDCLLDDSLRLFCNVLVDSDDRTIADMWLSLRRPDVSDLRHELRRLFSEHRAMRKPKDKPPNRPRRGK